MSAGDRMTERPATSDCPRSGAEKEKGWEQMAEGNGGETAQSDKRRGRPTMTDVARIAGVSQSSVSLVLNEMTGSRISADTQNRVIDAARQIGYALPAIRREAHSFDRAQYHRLSGGRDLDQPASGGQSRRRARLRLRTGFPGGGACHPLESGTGGRDDRLDQAR